MEAVIAWMVSFMVAMAPPGRPINIPGGQETEQAALARYHEIAQDIAEVVYDPTVKPAFRGPDGRSQTVAVILSIMFHESSFMRHVDYAIGEKGRGDRGKSWCMMQLNIGDGRTIAWNKVHDRPIRPNDPKKEIFWGYTGPELIAERKRCIREGLKIVRLSVYACKPIKFGELRIYASGSCYKGMDKSRERMRTASEWYYRTLKSRGFTDKEAIAALTRESLTGVDNRG